MSASTSQLTYDLLRDFAETTEGARYAADSERIKLLSLYILLRQCTPNLTFELFLEKFRPIADFTPENRKHPDDAVRHHCPRGQKQAQEQNVPQWSAKEVVDILVLYTDMCRAADTAGEPVPLNLDEYLAMDGPAYKRGEIAPPERTTRRGRRKEAGTEAEATSPAAASTEAATQVTRTAPPATADLATGVNAGSAVLPTAAGQRVLYTHPTQKRQLRGIVTGLSEENGRRYVDFTTDEGELLEGCAIEHFQVTNDQTPPPLLEETQRADVKKSLWLLKAEYTPLAEAYQLRQPLGNVELGQPIASWTVDFENGFGADIQVMNGQTGPYVDSQLVDLHADNVVLELVPRSRLLGSYIYRYAGKCYVVEVKTRA